MPDLDLAVSVRNYARNHGGDLVSSAWLADHFGVDPRTIAAALRPYGVAPGEVERGVRGYQIADLAGIVLPGDTVVEEWAAEALRPAFEHAIVVDPADLPEQVDGGWRCGRCKTPMTGTGRCLDCWPASDAPDVLEGRIPTEASATPDDLANHWSSHMTPEELAARPLSCVFPTAEALAAAGFVGDDGPDAISRLSAGAGHDMTPALRAAGLL